MKVKALKRYRDPSYPTADELRERPELLEARPCRWIGTGAAAVASMALGGGGCSAGAAARPAAAAVEPEAPTETAPAPAPEGDAPEGDGGAAAAPEGDGGAAAAARPAGGSPPSLEPFVFEAGRGRASVGCVVVAPPVFLTEDEAWETVQAELERAGLAPARGGPRVPGLTMPRFRVDQPVDLQVDGADQGRGVAVVFLSRGDLEGFEQLGRAQHPGEPFMMSSVHGYDFLESARELASQLGRPSGLALGVFYDPGTCSCRGSYCAPEWGCQGDPERAHAKSVADLRDQVRHFVAFLRSSGVL